MKSDAGQSQFSLTPDFSPVMKNEGEQNRFNGFAAREKAVKTASIHAAAMHPAKAGC
jgi:hypothetical protein